MGYTLLNLFLSLAQLMVMASLWLSPGRMERSDRPLNEVPQPPFALICNAAVPSLRISNSKVTPFGRRHIGSMVTVVLSHAHMASLFICMGGLLRTPFAPGLPRANDFFAAAAFFLAEGLGLGFLADMDGLDWARADPTEMQRTIEAAAAIPA